MMTTQETKPYIKELIDQANGAGFLAIRAQGILAEQDIKLPIREAQEHEPGHELLSKKDFGLVPISIGLVKSQIDSSKWVPAEAVVFDGVPIISSVQQEVVHRAAIMGESFASKVHPFTQESIGNENDPTINIYGFPGNVLRWSMGTGYSDKLADPVFTFHFSRIKSQFHPSFVVRDGKRIYVPNEEELENLGYTEEGKRRLVSLGLMTRIVSFANGSERVQINPASCQMIVVLDEKDKTFKAKTGEPVTGIYYSLQGIKAVAANSHLVDLSQLRNFNGDYSAVSEEVARLCKDTIARDLAKRNNVTTAARAASQIFE